MQSKEIDEPIYFIKDSKKIYWQNNQRNFDNDFYTVFKVENNNIEKIELKKEDLPNNVKVNDVLKIKNHQYTVDEVLTNEILQEIKQMANEIIQNQNVNLEQFKKEGHIYQIREKLENNCFLCDITENTKVEFEEVNIPQDLLKNIAVGDFIKFENGRYERY